jgi:hypothetical protein
MRSGTRFRLFPQAPFGNPIEPETVRVSSPAGSLGPGPSDRRMYVVDPIERRQPYGLAHGLHGVPVLYLPPWDGPIAPPAMPGPGGHFDHLVPGTREFEAAHVFGTIRFVLDVWEGYFGRPIPWHFERHYRRLEIMLNRDLDNALAGYGFIEAGADTGAGNQYRPFSLNFDVIAHEVGHLIIYSEIGVPGIEIEAGEHLGFQEAAADLIALISVLHFDSVVHELLENSHGNLYTFNKLNRFGELSHNEQIRLASNPLKLSDFAFGWYDEHDLAEPLIGAMFDILVDVFHESLLDRELIRPEVEDLADRLERRPEYAPLIQLLFDEAYARDSAGFKEALLDARDDLGLALAATLRQLSPHGLSYEDVGEAMLTVDRAFSAGRYQRLIVNNFRWREIGRAVVGPRLAPPAGVSHTFSARTLLPEDNGSLPGPHRRVR